jgi:hypothetical protein
VTDLIRELEDVRDRLNALIAELKAPEHREEQRAAWQEAVSSRNAELRRQGHRRLPPDITGVRPRARGDEG